MDDEAAAPAARRTERVLGAVRLVAGLWGIVMVLTYADYPASYADPVRGVSLASLAVFMVAAVALWAALELHVGWVTPDRSAIIGLGLDLGAISVIAFAFGFDRASATWIIVFLVPVEGAMRDQLRGALVTFGVVVAGYAAREVAWSTWLPGQAIDVRSAVFRLTVVGIVTALVGLISEQLRVERELVDDALSRAEASDNWRSRLVSALGHDLRSPLAAIEMQAGAASDPRLSEDQRASMLGGIVRQAERLRRLSEGLLDLALAQEAKLELRVEPTPLGDLVRRTLDGSPLGDRLVVHVQDDLVVPADPQRVEQVVHNLVENASKYGLPPVEVTVRAAGGEVLLEVRDHGPGVPPERREELFEAFTTGGGQQAVGFGLWLVAAIVAGHGGSIDVEDAGPGARFVVRLPATAPPGRIDAGDAGRSQTTAATA